MTLLSLTEDLWKEQSREDPNAERCKEILEKIVSMSDVQSPTSTSDKKFERTLTACRKTFRKRKRSSTEKVAWQELLELIDAATLAQSKQGQSSNADARSNEDDAADDDESFPTSVSAYLARLKRQKKDLYKNPPVLPPDPITIREDTAKPPSRNKKTRRYTFADFPEFRPNTSPVDVLSGGAFGGTYFRSIHSAVTNMSYRGADVVRDTLDPQWIEGLDVKHLLTSQTYLTNVNKYGAKCGGSLGMWESSGWISDVDPYGWFQWYCRFFQGRRCSDDVRQIARWKGVAGAKGRFKSQLCNKILASVSSGASHASAIEDTSISPVIRQTLFHWGLTITEDVLTQHERR